MKAVGRPIRRRLSAGFTLVEITVTAALFVVVFLASVSLITRDRSLSGQALYTAHIELASQDLLFSLEHELANAFGERPVGVAPLGLTAGATSLQLDSTLGFPPTGTLIIDRGKDSEERIRYNSLGDDRLLIEGLTRGVDCSSDVAHGVQTEVLWGGLAEPLAQQDPPPDPEDFDGISMETAGPVFFRGDGTGFSYRVPVDPDDEGTFLSGDDLMWGAEVPGVGATLSGWQAIYFQPRTEFDESMYGDDVNRDGDLVDVFDVGQLRRATWDTSDPDINGIDVGIGPSVVLQERCNYGSDLDGDGFDDPIFLWDPWTNELHLRLYLIGTTHEDEPILRQIDSVMFLRNEPEL